MSYRSRILGGALFLLLASVIGCATTVGALRAPVSDCTSHCNYLTGEANRFACLQSCPGARYTAGEGCSDDEPASLACASDERDDTAQNLQAAALVIDLFATVVDASSKSCHHYGH